MCSTKPSNEQKRQIPINYELVAALRAVQYSAKRAGLDKLNEREVDAEVTAYRRERDKKNFDYDQICLADRSSTKRSSEGERFLM